MLDRTVNLFRHASYRLALMAPTALGLISCASVPPIENPIPSIGSYQTTNSATALIVMLPGMGDRAGNFQEGGFFGVANEKIDLRAVDAHFGYYRARTLLPRLREDIIGPATAKGYEQIWLLGVSMGGLGSLLYMADDDSQISGLILLAPFLGDRKLIEEIKEAGGLTRWTPTEGRYPDYEVAIWRWLKTNAMSQTPVPIILGFGESDRLADSYGPLLETLDANFVFRSDGGHNWKTWLPLWQRISSCFSDETCLPQTRP